MCNIAVISLHTSPVARPGTRDSGGMNVYIRELSRELGRRYHRDGYLTRRADPSTPEVVQIDANTRVIQVDSGPVSDGKESLRQHLPQFLRGVLAFQERGGISYDLIHSHYWLSGWVGQVFRTRWGVPHIIMFHTLGEAKNRSGSSEREPGYRIEAEREIAAGADRIICASEEERGALIHHYGVSQERIEVVPCGVDTDLFSPMDRGDVRAELGLPRDKPVILFVGRIEPLKGIDILLRRWPDSIHLPVCSFVGGDAKDSGRKADLRALARQLGIDRRVEFVDAVEHDRLPLYYNAADVCVIPSYYESFGLVALEAMSCGVPVVASDVGGLRDTVRDGQTGYLVPWRCPEPFAERLELVLGNQALGRSLGLIGRSAVERFAGLRWLPVSRISITSSSGRTVVR